jgi:hypothetical protein
VQSFLTMATPCHCTTSRSCYRSHDAESIVTDTTTTTFFASQHLHFLSALCRRGLPFLDPRFRFYGSALCRLRSCHVLSNSRGTTGAGSPFKFREVNLPRRRVWDVKSFQGFDFCLGEIAQMFRSERDGGRYSACQKLRTLRQPRATTKREGRECAGEKRLQLTELAALNNAIKLACTTSS